MEILFPENLFFLERAEHQRPEVSGLTVRRKKGFRGKDCPEVSGGKQKIAPKNSVEIPRSSE